MPIELKCVKCQKPLRVPDSAAGKRAKCPECGELMSVPGGDLMLPLGGAADSAPILLPTTSEVPLGSLPPLGGSIPAAGDNPFSDSRGPVSPALNPYASPGPVPSYLPTIGPISREEALNSVYAPAMLLILYGSFSLFMAVVCGAGFGAFMIGSSDMKPDEQAIVGVFCLGMLVFFTILSVVMIVGGLKLKNLSSHTMALWGAIAAMVSASQVCACGCLGVPGLAVSLGVAIFALAKINDARIRPHFLK